MMEKLKEMMEVAQKCIEFIETSTNQEKKIIDSEVVEEPDKVDVSSMNIGEAADKLYLIRQKRFALQKEVDALKKSEAEIEAYLVDELPKVEAKGVAGAVARVQIKTKDVPIVEDWDAVYRYIAETNNYQLLNRRINTTAYTELAASGENIDGISERKIISLGLNKI